MSRQLKMADIQAIQALHRAGHSQREIARLTGIHRETVSRYVSASEPQPAKPDHRVQSGPRNACDPFRELILQKLEQGLSGIRIWQDLREECVFRGSYSSVRRFLQALAKQQPLPYRRIETAPGEEAQVDFGLGAWVVENGKRRRPWLFRIVLSYSRKSYSEVVWRQTTDNFLACLENAFEHFGGVPQRLVIDNLKAAVKRADWYDPELHPKIQSFAQHYGTVFMPTRPFTPRHKGKIEGGVKYAQNNCLKGRQFASLAAQNEHLWQWESQVADQRIHGTTKQQVAALFREEQPALRRLPSARFPSFQEARRSFYRDGYVEVDKAYYSAPPEYLDRRLWVRWDTRLVRLFNDRWEQVAVHARIEPGRYRTEPQHIPAEKVSGVERGTAALLRQVAAIGPQTQQWAQAAVQARGVEAVRMLVGLKALAAQHAPSQLEAACAMALASGAYYLRTIRHLLQRCTADRQTQFDFIEHHPVIRPLSDYSLESIHQFRKER